MEKRLPSAKVSTDPEIRAAIGEATGRPQRPSASVRHAVPGSFLRKQPLDLQLTSPMLATARLHYRHVNQAERWCSVLMDRKGPAYVASIPGAYTGSPYPLQYYFELRSGPDRAWMYPGLPPDLAGQPYFVILG